MASRVYELFDNGKPAEHGKIMSEIEQYENDADQYEEEISNYIVKVASNDLSKDSSLDIRRILNAGTSLERAADELNLISRHIDRMHTNEELALTPAQRNKLEELFQLIKKALQAASDNLNNAYDEVVMDEARSLENQINTIIKEMREQNLQDLENQTYDIRSGIIYRDIFNSLETMGDYLVEISENITGQYAEEDNL